MTLSVTPAHIAVGFAAGLASALMALSPLGGTGLAVPLSAMTGLPLAIATLGWGTMAGLIATLAGTVALAAIHPVLAVNFLAFMAPPAVIGSHYIGLARPLSGEGAAIEWYPLERVAVIQATLVVIGAVVSAVASQFNPAALSPEQLAALSQAYSEAMQGTEPGFGREDAARLQAAVRDLLPSAFAVLPLVFTAIWTIVAIVTLYLGARIVSLSGRLARPWPRLEMTALPGWLAPVAVVGLGGATLGGPLGSIAMAVAGATLALMFLSGLAVLHVLTRRVPGRMAILTVVYLLIGLFTVPLLILGALEPILTLRRRLALRPD